MTPNEQIQPTSQRVSIIARIVPALSYAFPALGAAVSALLFIRVMEAMRNAESAGIAAIAGGISEANIAIIVTLYLAVFVGVAGLIIGIARTFSTLKAATPSAWFFLIAGALGLFPMFTLWCAQSMLLDMLFTRIPPEGGVAAVASQISLLLMVTIISAVIIVLILLAGSVIPLPRILRAKRRWAPIVALVLMEIIMIAMTVGYHWRTSWLYAQTGNY